MKYSTCRLLTLMILLLRGFTGRCGPADEVDPLIGTAKSVRPTVWESNGACFPGVLAPHGMVQITPDGYHYTDTHIRGFSYLDHGSGWSSNGRFLVIPYVGSGASPSAFSHSREESHPWRYEVDLSDYGIHAAFAATIHAGFARMTFPRSDDAHILLSDVSRVTVLSDTSLTGYCNGSYFFLLSGKAFHAVLIDGGGVRLDYRTGSGDAVDIRTGFSTRSVAAATNNLATEMPDGDFKRYSREGRDNWNTVLSHIEIQGGDATHRKIFYTAFYHSCFMPSIVSDAGVSPRRYTPTYPWDTYRSEHPLNVLLNPDAEGEVIASTLSAYDQTGWLPTGNMLGNHNVELILDAYMKGVRNFSVDKAAMAIRKSLMTAPYARRDMGLFHQLGYVPAEQVNSVSQTLEFAYNCWAGAKFLKAVAEADGDVDTLFQRAFSYQRLYDPGTGFMQAVKGNGDFTDGGYCEGTAWTYSWYVPHDVRGLVNLMGGPERFSGKLEECFDKGHYVHDNEPPSHYAYLFDFVGRPWKTQEYARMITENSYAAVPGGLPGNDDLGALSSWYIFSAMGFYPVTPGEPLYELGSPVFETCILHLPNGKKFTIRAPGSSAKRRYIRAARLNGRAYGRPWITHKDILAGGTLTLEMGVKPNKHWGIADKDAPPSLTMGGPEFRLAGLSKTTGRPSLSATNASAGDSVEWSCLMSNDGSAAGSVRLDIFIDGRLYGSRSVLIEAGRTQRVSIPVTLYQAGAHRITLGRSGFPLTFTIAPKAPVFSYSDLSIPLPHIVRPQDSMPVSVMVRNRGSRGGSAQVRLIVDGLTIDSRTVFVPSGQEKKAVFIVAGRALQPLSTIGVNELPSVTVRLIDDRPLPPFDTAMLRKLCALVVLDFEHHASDQSGKGNDGLIHGTPRWVNGLFGKAVQLDAPHGCYIELKPGPSLDTLVQNEGMTMMAWVYPMEEENFSDILCRGDWHTLQLKASNTIVNFYSAGWEGHEAFAPVPANWNRHWHHIAGVTRGDIEELYIDGHLSAVKRMEPRDPNGETGLTDYSNHPWSIGRNDGDPTRIFKGYIDDVMIFGKALQPADIHRLMSHLPENP
ncbi:MAG: GH92 family glycosyl hydrolase [Chitinophagaceae bacterium]|nr:GH92 family glycosyl hydrolase [Chitinophagaceae bacterium]